MLFTYNRMPLKTTADKSNITQRIEKDMEDMLLGWEIKETIHIYKEHVCEGTNQNILKLPNNRRY